MRYKYMTYSQDDWKVTECIKVKSHSFIVIMYAYILYNILLGMYKYLIQTRTVRCDWAMSQFIT